MARYTGPKTKISRIYGEPILGNGKWLTKNSNPPGQHGATRKRKTLGEYALQLREKQKAKYTYGLLERQFRKTFEEASRIKGVTGENLIKLLEARLDNTVFRLGLAASRPEARQLLYSLRNIWQAKAFSPRLLWHRKRFPGCLGTSQVGEQAEA